MAKVLVSLDDHLLRRLDEEAAARKLSRSALISALVARELRVGKGPGADPKVWRALAEHRKAVLVTADEELQEAGGRWVRPL